MSTKRTVARSDASQRLPLGRNAGRFGGAILAGVVTGILSVLTLGLAYLALWWFDRLPFQNDPAPARVFGWTAGLAILLTLVVLVGLAMAWASAHAPGGV